MRATLFAMVVPVFPLAARRGQELSAKDRAASLAHLKRTRAGKSRVGSGPRLELHAEETALPAAIPAAVARDLG